jgi:hypothetical protein
MAGDSDSSDESRDDRHDCGGRKNRPWDSLAIAAVTRRAARPTRRVSGAARLDASMGAVVVSDMLIPSRAGPI